MNRPPRDPHSGTPRTWMQWTICVDCAASEPVGRVSATTHRQPLGTSHATPTGSGGAGSGETRLESIRHAEQIDQAAVPAPTHRSAEPSRMWLARGLQEPSRRQQTGQSMGFPCACTGRKRFQCDDLCIAPTCPEFRTSGRSWTSQPCLLAIGWSLVRWRRPLISRCRAVRKPAILLTRTAADLLQPTQYATGMRSGTCPNALAHGDRAAARTVIRARIRT